MFLADLFHSYTFIFIFIFIFNNSIDFKAFTDRMLESSQLSAALHSRIRSVHALKQHTPANYKGPSQFWGTRDFFSLFLPSPSAREKNFKKSLGPQNLALGSFVWIPDRKVHIKVISSWWFDIFLLAQVLVVICLITCWYYCDVWIWLLSSSIK